jgi:haloalkane dehalogenase
MTSPTAPVNGRTAAALAQEPRTPFLVAVSDGDPITAAMSPVLQRSVPGAAGLVHPVLREAGNLLQEDAGTDLGQVVAEFMSRS